MLNLVPTPSQPSVPCFVAVASPGSTRKYDKTLELVQDKDVFVGIQSRLANDMVHAALQQGLIPELRNWSQLKREVSVSASGPNAKKGKDKDSRTDFQLLWCESEKDTDTTNSFAMFACNTPSPPTPSIPSDSCSNKGNTGKIITNMLMEVKSVTLAQEMHLPPGQRLSVFPDCVSDRASKHLRCLMDHKLSNPLTNRSVVFFLVQRDDCNRFSPCHLDPTYTALLGNAVTAGVEIIAYSICINPNEGNVVLGQKMSYVPNPLPDISNISSESKAAVTAGSASAARRKKATKRTTTAFLTTAKAKAKADTEAETEMMPKKTKVR